MLEKIILKISRGLIGLHPSQAIALHNDVAMKLINEGRIIPIGKVMYKIYSKILKDYLWIVATEKELQKLVDDSFKEAIYTQEEVSRMIDEGVSEEGLKTLHKIKKSFFGAIIDDIEYEEKHLDRLE